MVGTCLQCSIYIDLRLNNLQASLFLCNQVYFYLVSLITNHFINGCYGCILALSLHNQIIKWMYAENSGCVERRAKNSVADLPTCETSMMCKTPVHH